MSKPEVTHWPDGCVDPERIILTDEQRRIGATANSVLEHWKKSTSWTAHHVAQEKLRSDFMREFVGLHRYDLNGVHRYDIIFAQGQKINGLKQQMAQMQKGYRRKVARLEKQIAALKESQHEQT